ncbi:MAG: polyphosphate polymerase domain-containing protein [Eubacterium sp.]|nr:polyphosphate polymerase domain-containing protein [Eubacterium sp.]
MQYRDRKLRFELKYPATAAQCEILRQRFASAMTPDEHGGKYRVTSLYLDDIYMSAYNDKLLGGDVRKKYRIRTYNLDEKLLRFECKYKDREMTSKRSMWINKEMYYRILDGDFFFAGAPELEGSVLWDASVSNSLARLRPSVIVDYNREAFINREGNVRFTIDSGFKVGVFSDDMLSDRVRYIPVTESPAVVEIKYDELLPVHLADLIQGVKLERAAFSKFLICRDKLSEMHKSVY